MSKEREFLKKLRYASLLENDLRKELEELLAQPEPFMFKDRKSTGSLIVHDAMYKRGYARAELDLKREPLSEKEIREGNESMLNVTREIFIKGVRFAEVMHGIGEDDEN